MKAAVLTHAAETWGRISAFVQDFAVFLYIVVFPMPSSVAASVLFFLAIFKVRTISRRSVSRHGLIALRKFAGTLVTFLFILSIPRRLQSQIRRSSTRTRSRLEGVLSAFLGFRPSRPRRLYVGASASARGFFIHAFRSGHS